MYENGVFPIVLRSNLGSWTVDSFRTWHIVLVGDPRIRRCPPSIHYRTTFKQQLIHLSSLSFSVLPNVFLHDSGFYPLIMLMVSMSIGLKKVFGTGFGGGMVTYGGIVTGIGSGLLVSSFAYWFESYFVKSDKKDACVNTLLHPGW